MPVVGIELTTYRLQGGCSTTELNRQKYYTLLILLYTVCKGDCGGGDKDRTCYILLAKQALSQMSYTPKYYGSSTWARTRDQRINSPALYQLSYRGTESLNLCTCCTSIVGLIVRLSTWCVLITLWSLNNNLTT